MTTTEELSTDVPTPTYDDQVAASGFDPLAERDERAAADEAQRLALEEALADVADAADAEEENSEDAASGEEDVTGEEDVLVDVTEDGPLVQAALADLHNALARAAEEYRVDEEAQALEGNLPADASATEATDEVHGEEAGSEAVPADDTVYIVDLPGASLRLVDAESEVEAEDGAESEVEAEDGAEEMLTDEERLAHARRMVIQARASLERPGGSVKQTTMMATAAEYLNLHREITGDDSYPPNITRAEVQAAHDEADARAAARSGNIDTTPCDETREQINTTLAADDQIRD